MKSFVLLITFFFSQGMFALDIEEKDTISPVVTNSFWDNWYGQVGADMILLFPKGHAVKDVFPNGKSLGLTVAVGKWFSPEFGGRLKVTWNNAFIKEKHNIWYWPYGVEGGSHHEGGFITFSGDIQLNLHNLFGVYKPDRKWNLIFLITIIIRVKIIDIL